MWITELQQLPNHDSDIIVTLQNLHNIQYSFFKLLTFILSLGNVDNDKINASVRPDGLSFLFRKLEPSAERIAFVLAHSLFY